LLMFFLCVVAINVFSQDINAIRPIEKSMQRTSVLHKPFQLGGDSNIIVINYDSADAEAWGSSNYTRNQTQLMNMNYSYPADSSAGNYYVINYFAVAFDSLIDPYSKRSFSPDSIDHLFIDTLIIPLVHVNHSGVNDTLEVQLNLVNSMSYPISTVLMDSKIIGVQIGDTNSNLVINYLKIPENYDLSSGTRFAVTVKYYGAKVDSCWFIYGYGSFVGSCNGGIYTLAEPSNFSKVQDSKGSFTANSFIQYNKYSSVGLYPTSNGNMLYYSCTGDSVFSGGSDGASYFQNINVYAMITTVPLGINELQNDDFSITQNFPNPFTNTTLVSYNLKNVSDIDFSVSDITGRKLLENKYSKVSPGQYSISLSSGQFLPGVYFYSLEVNGSSVTRKMVISR
jgi:hypothetical protein